MHSETFIEMRRIAYMLLLFAFCLPSNVEADSVSNVDAGIDSRSRWEYYTNVIPRYVMLRLVYRFDKQPKNKRNERL